MEIVCAQCVCLEGPIQKEGFLGPPPLPSPQGLWGNCQLAHSHICFPFHTSE